MTRLAFADILGVEVSVFEEQRDGPSYTANLLRDYTNQSGDDVYFIVGVDSLRDMRSWRSPEEIVALCTLVVFPRAGVEPVLTVPGEASLIVFEEPLVDVSSSDIRDRVRTGRPFESLVPPTVAEYIKSHALYSR